jgi:Cyclin, N-terminal domain
MNDDLALRPPLPFIVDVQRHNAFLRPMISSLLVGAHVLQLSLETRFTAAVLLHRYYAATGISITDEDDSHEECKYVAAACLFLACKREEEPRRLRDLINFVHMVDWKSSLQPDDAIAAPTVTVQWNPTPPDLDAGYWKSKDLLVQTEQRVLRLLAFDVAVSHPHRVVALLLNDENGVAGDESTSVVVDERRSQLLRMALRMLNDTVYSALALQQPVLPLAVAAVALAEAAEQGSSKDPFSVTSQRWCKSVPVVNDAEVETAMTILRRLQNL